MLPVAFYFTFQGGSGCTALAVTHNDEIAVKGALVWRMQRCALEEKKASALSASTWTCPRTGVHAQKKNSDSQRGNHRGGC